MEMETYIQVKKSVFSLLGINLDHYKDEQMRRRLDSWLARSGSPGWNDYFGRVKSDENEFTRFRNFLTINVTEFFRDFERWNSLKTQIIPRLLQESMSLRPTGNGLRIWSAGCSIGAEPYTLAMVMDELAPARRHYILGTDLDRGALSKATAGGPYLNEELKNITPAQKAVYFKAGGPPFYMQESMVKKITFKEQNMIQDKFEGDFDLVVCRNVVIYFTSETKDMLYRKFHEALRPGGILFVGGTEIIPRPQELNFRSQGISFYMKV